MFIYSNNKKKNANLVYEALYSLTNHQGTLQDVLSVDHKFKPHKVKLALNLLVNLKLVVSTNNTIYTIE